MQPIFDSRGVVVGWLHGNVVYDAENNARAFIHGAHLFAYQGQHLGEFASGYFWDHDGDAVAFLAAAQEGPPLPRPQIPPKPPIPRTPPIAPVPPAPPKPAIRGHDWSRRDWRRYLSGT